MKKLLSVLLVALLMVGCGEDAPQENGNGGDINLDDPETRKKISAEALEVDVKTLPAGLLQGEGLFHAPNEQTPYTGWVKPMLGKGQIMGLMQFKDGKPHGLVVSFYPNGAKQSEVTFKDGKREGLMTQWHESGHKQTEANWKDGNEHGLVTEWYESGQKRWEGNWRNGKLDGLDTTWHENGKKERETTYKDGQSISVKRWDEDGNLQDNSSGL